MVIRMNWSDAPGWIALIVAVISPIATSLINNRSNYKLKVLDSFQSRKLEAIEGYLRHASDSLYLEGETRDFAMHKYLIFFHAPRYVHNKIREFHALIGEETSRKNAELLLTEIAIALHEENHIADR